MARLEGSDIKNSIEGGEGEEGEVSRIVDIEQLLNQIAGDAGDVIKR